MGLNSKRQLTGLFLTGAAVGAAIALLYAPKAGVQTRKEIRKFSKRTFDNGRDQMMEVFDNVKDYVGDSKTKLQKIIKSA
ncbi:MAG TPA: YtxH domain-containing protein [Terriglobia bacterium]|nr:YtxH domain-containing protein [Terriglobia bacterium]